MIASYDLAGATALVLVGGLGTRLRSVVPDRPKALASIGGRPFLSYLLDQLGAAGLRRVILCTGHLGRQIRSTYGDSYEDLRLIYSHESEPAGTGGALRLARSRIDSSSVLVLNGDSYCDADFHQLWSWHHVHPAHVSMVTTSVRDARSSGRVVTDGKDRVVRFAEKTPGEGPGHIDAGIYLMHTALLERIPADRPVSLENELLPRWVSDGGVFAYPTSALSLDIGTPERFARAGNVLRALSAHGRHRTAVGEIAHALASVQGTPR